MTIYCPSCNGRKKQRAHLNYGNGRGEWKDIDCFTCKGIGTVTPEHMALIRDGRKLRQDRISRGVTLRDEAAALGITAVELSRMERGVCFPIQGSTP